MRGLWRYRGSVNKLLESIVTTVSLLTNLLLIKCWLLYKSCCTAAWLGVLCSHAAVACAGCKQRFGIGVVLCSALSHPINQARVVSYAAQQSMKSLIFAKAMYLKGGSRFGTAPHTGFRYSSTDRRAQELTDEHNARIIAPSASQESGECSAPWRLRDSCQSLVITQ